MLFSHQNAAPQSAYVDIENCLLIILDSLIDKHLDHSTNMLMKTDVQGYEWQVLDESKFTIKLAKAFLFETSLISLYEDQKIYREIIERIENEDFMLWTFRPAFVDPKNVRTLKEDSLFFH
jgi:hypothetical protein